MPEEIVVRVRPIYRVAAWIWKGAGVAGMPVYAAPDRLHGDAAIAPGRSAPSVVPDHRQARPAGGLLFEIEPRGPAGQCEATRQR
jgi:hypothetical protein